MVSSLLDMAADIEQAGTTQTNGNGGNERAFTAPGVSNRSERYLPNRGKYQPRGRSETIDIGQGNLRLFPSEWLTPKFDEHGKPAYKQKTDPLTGEITTVRADTTIPWDKQRPVVQQRMWDSIDFWRALGATLGKEIVCTQHTSVDGAELCGPHKTLTQMFQERAELVLQGALYSQPELVLRMAEQAVEKKVARELAAAEAEAAAAQATEGDPGSLASELEDLENPSEKSGKGGK